MYKFTIIAYAGENYSPDPLFKSLLAFPDPDLIQLIVTDATADALYRVYFEEAGRTGRIAVRYLACPGKNIAECYNLAIPEIKGEYTAFVDTDSEYSDTCLSRVRVVINSPEFTGKNYICVMPYFVGTDDEPLLYKICPRSGGSKDIRNNPSPVILCLYAYFIRTTLVCGMRFREDCPIDARQMFILDLMEKETVYYLAGKQSVFYRHALENTTAFFTGSHEKVWYTDTLKHVYLPYIKERYERGELTLEQEEAILYLIYARFSCNMNQSDKKLLDEQEIREFYEIVHELLRYIHYDVIVQRKKLGHFTLPVWLVWDFMKNKARLCGDADGLVFSGGSMLMDINNEEETALPCKFRLYTFQNNSISIYAINFIDNQLVIDASLPALPVDWLPYLGVTATGAETEPREVYNITRCFGQIVARAYMFRARMDLARKKDTQSIRFSVTLLNRSYVMPLTFSKPAARLHASVKESYWLFGGNRLLTCDASGRRLNIRKCSRHELMVTEANYCNAIKHDATLTDDQKQELISLRKDYWEARFSGEKASTPNASRPIWITYDKLYKGGDNGEYLYHYVRDNCPDIDMYYVLSEDSPDYLRLRDDSHVLVHKSRRCKELALRADIILATHVNALRYCGLTETYEDKYLRNLSNGRVVCLQHGLTTQELAIFQNSLFDNTRLYLCASRYEIANLLQPVYGYEESQMRLCGLARYDGLVSRSRKQILITPTWRNYDANGGIAFHKKTHTDYFRQSDYFRIYNTLINDPRLISCAKQYGYRVIFLLHPAMSSQMEDYDRNEYVELVAAAGDLNYEKILTESALMVTDYSGVQFDFAYMRKPVLYYHPEALPPHYPESRFFQYKTMGFGPVLTEHGDLIEQICAYMENDCQMKQEYRDRADDFFAFRDTDSCRRIYEAVADFMKEDDYLQAFQMKKQDALDTLALEDAQEKARDKAQIKALNKALEDARKSNEKLEQQAGALKASWSYRLGHALVLLPGKIKRLLE